MINTNEDHLTNQQNPGAGANIIPRHLLKNQDLQIIKGRHNPQIIRAIIQNHWGRVIDHQTGVIPSTYQTRMEASLQNIESLQRPKKNAYKMVYFKGVCCAHQTCHTKQNRVRKPYNKNTNLLTPEKQGGVKKIYLFCF